MTRGAANQTMQRNWGRISEGSRPPWKSGASAPRRGALPCAGFSHAGRRGLKAFPFAVRDPALEGPLFHGGVKVKAAILATGLFVLMVSSWGQAQVTFERLVNSAK